MTTWTLVKRSLRFYWRTHLGVVLGAAVSTAILVGALVVGDSVRYSLKTLALSRLGKVQLAMAPQNRYFRAKLADDMETALDAATAPVLLLRGIVANSDGSARVSHVQVLGVDERFWALGNRTSPPAPLHKWRGEKGGSRNVASPHWGDRRGAEVMPMFDEGLSDEVFLNERLAAQLVVHEGEEILLRLEKPSLLPRDAPLSTDTDSSVAMRLNVKGIVSDSNFGRFSLQANQIAPFNVFVPLVWLQKKVGLSERANHKPKALVSKANMLLVGDSPKGKLTPAIANAKLREHWELADADLELRELPEQGVLELRTNRVFLEPPVVLAAERAMPDAAGILTYFINELRLGNRTTPYSMVTAIGLTSYEPRHATRNTQHETRNTKHETRNTKHATLPLSAAKGRNTQYIITNRQPDAHLPSDMNDNEILINSWLAEDLQAKPGDVLELTYFVVGPMFVPQQFTDVNRRKLEERTSQFRIRAVLPLEGAAADLPALSAVPAQAGATLAAQADRELMPMFPGLSDVENCRDWEPGIPIDLDKIRKKDEEYWDLYRGTPKAFVTLKAGQRMWGNRFGNLTALRYPVNHADAIKTIEAAIKRELDPASIGLFFQPVREQALAASTQAMDFGQLFLGLSFFLIVAALLLMGMLFVLGIEQRTEEVGTLLAVGFPPRRVRRLLLFEGGVLAILGGFLGVGGGIGYTQVVLYALSTVWRNAVGAHGGTAVSLYYHSNPSTLVVGAASGIVVALLAIWVTLRRQAKSPARELLAPLLSPQWGEATSIANSDFRLSPLSTSGEGPGVRSDFRFGLWVALGAIVGTLVILVLMGKGKDKEAAAAFFISGALLLIGGLGFSQALLSALAHSGSRSHQDFGRMKLTGLGLRNSVRRIGRSLATVVLLACGSFLIIAVGANRYDPHPERSEGTAEQRSSGTGGFALFAESTLPVFHDLNSKQGREMYGLDSEYLEGVKFVSLRVHDGDDASCLNLNRVQTPRLLGIRPEELQSRNAFTFRNAEVSASALRVPSQAQERLTHSKARNPWMLLKRNENDDTVPAIGDEATITWALGKKIGDTLLYTDERGNTFNLRLVGAVANSIFQGSLLISEDEFIAHFPSESGYRMFLIDAPWKNAPEVSKTLSRSLRDVGLEITPTSQRLSEFNTVQNTYLSIFQLLGGLALLLGSVGLGIVVMRNVMERRSELALLRAVGFEKRSLKWLVLSEHWLLLLLGLACGVVAGLVAVLPALRSPGADIPYLSLVLTLSAVVLSGVLWTWIATMLAIRGPLLAALRNE
jgi:ABC-type antimicrobial peptide transport system permease subunit